MNEQTAVDSNQAINQHQSGTKRRPETKTFTNSLVKCWKLKILITDFAYHGLTCSLVENTIDGMHHRSIECNSSFGFSLSRVGTSQRGTPRVCCPLPYSACDAIQCLQIRKIRLHNINYSIKMDCSFEILRRHIVCGVHPFE